MIEKLSNKIGIEEGKARILLLVGLVLLGGGLIAAADSVAADEEEDIEVNEDEVLEVTANMTDDDTIDPAEFTIEVTDAETGDLLNETVVTTAEDDENADITNVSHGEQITEEYTNLNTTVDVSLSGDYEPESLEVDTYSPGAFTSMDSSQGAVAGIVIVALIIIGALMYREQN